MKSFKFPIIFITIFIILGIMAGQFIELSIPMLFFINFGFLLILLALHKLANRKINAYKLFSIGLVVSSFSFGILLQKRMNQSNFSSHYSHYILKNQPNILQLEIQNRLKPTKNYFRYIGKIYSINQNESFGKILIKQKKSDNPLAPGQNLKLLLNKNDFKLPPKALNPYAFDYRKYLAKKGIYHEILMDKTAWKSDKNKSSTSVIVIAEQIRHHIYNIFKRNGLKGKELALASALFLGERHYISKETLSDFQSAGTVHVLAISGLHIGILLWFLNFIFNFIKTRWGNFPFLLITLFILWFYAFLTGFSPSVLRAVIMFSFLQIGLQLRRETNIHNTLFSAAFIMILINPAIIYQIGFQMSFLAVLSIVSFFPIFSKPFKNWKQPFKWFTDLFMVSLSAQLGVLPLSLFYFHLFPTYFLLANLIIIPFLFVILIYGFSIMILSLSGIQLTSLFKIFHYLLNLLLELNNHIASLKKSSIPNIYFDKFLMIFSFFAIFLLYQWFKQKINFKLLITSLLLIISIQSYTIVKKYKISKEHHLYFLHQYGTDLVAESQGDYLKFYNKKEKIDSFLLNGFKNHFQKISFDSLKFIQNFDGKNILHIDSSGIWNFRDLPIDIIALHHSPKINLEKVIRKYQPKIIIADASNYPSYIKRWQHTASQYNIRFIDINKGSFVLNHKLSGANNSGSKSARESDL